MKSLFALFLLFSPLDAWDRIDESPGSSPANRTSREIPQVERGCGCVRLRRGLPRTASVLTRPPRSLLRRAGTKSRCGGTVLVRSGFTVFPCALGSCRLLRGEEGSRHKDLGAPACPGAPDYHQRLCPRWCQKAGRAVTPTDALFKAGTRPYHSTRTKCFLPAFASERHPSHPSSFILETFRNQTRQTHTHLSNAASRTRSVQPSLTIRRAHRRAAARPEHGTTHPVSIQRRAVTKCCPFLDSLPIRKRRGACRYRSCESSQMYLPIGGTTSENPSDATYGTGKSSRRMSPGFPGEGLMFGVVHHASRRAASHDGQNGRCWNFGGPGFGMHPETSLLPRRLIYFQRSALRCSLLSEPSLDSPSTPNHHSHPSHMAHPGSPRQNGDTQEGEKKGVPPKLSKPSSLPSPPPLLLFSAGAPSRWTAPGA